MCVFRYNKGRGVAYKKGIHFFNFFFYYFGKCMCMRGMHLSSFLFFLVLREGSILTGRRQVTDKS